MSTPERDPHRWIRALVCVACLAPLFTTPGMLREANTAFGVLALRMIALVAAAAVWARDWRGASRRTWTPIACVVAASSATYVVSAFAGVDFARSIWGSATRDTGVLGAACFVLMFFAARAAFADRAEWRSPFRVLCGLGIALCLVETTRAIATPGVEASQSDAQVAGIASTCVFVGWLALRGEERRGWRALAAGGALCGLVVVFLRGSIFSLAAIALGGAVAALGLRSAPAKEAAARRRIDWAVAAGALAFSVVLATKAGAIESVFDREGPIAARWGTAAQAGRYRPVAGVGPANYRLAHDYYFAPALLRHGDAHASAEDAGSVVATTFAERGSLGLVAHVALFGVALVVLLRRHEAGALDPHVAAVGMGFLTARFVHDLGAPADAFSWFSLALFLAFVDGRRTAPSAAAPRASLEATMAAVGATSTAAWFVCVLPAHALVLERHALEVAPPAVALTEYRRAAAAPSPWRDEFLVDFAPVGTSVAATSTDAASRDLLARMAGDLAEAWTRRWTAWESERVAPDVRLALAHADVVETQARSFGDATGLARAVAALEQAREFRFGDGRTDVRFALARTLARLGEQKRATDIAEQAVDDEPRAASSWWRLAEVYVLAGRVEDARGTLRDARRRGLVLSPEGERFSQALGDDD